MGNNCISEVDTSSLLLLSVEFCGRHADFRDEIHCICPFGSTYQDVKFDFVEDDMDEIVHVSYFCMPVRMPKAHEV